MFLGRRNRKLTGSQQAFRGCEEELRIVQRPEIDVQCVKSEVIAGPVMRFAVRQPPVIAVIVLGRRRRVAIYGQGAESGESVGIADMDGFQGYRDLVSESRCK